MAFISVLLQGCFNKSDTAMHDIYQESYKLDDTRLLVIILLYHDCMYRTCWNNLAGNKSDNIDKVVTSCQQLVPNLLTTWDKQCEHNLLTPCWQTC